MNGLGNRFSRENYGLPKPLIPVLGKPMLFWLLDNLNLKPVNSIIMPYTSLLDNYNFQSQLLERYPDVNFQFIPLSYSTRGAAETIQIALQTLDQADLLYNFMLMDCDTFYFQDIVSDYQTSNNPNTIFYFTDIQDQPIFSYITLQEGQVTDIAEKRRISDFANCGVYCFSSGRLLLDYCNKLLNTQLTVNNEYYVSGIYKKMLEDGMEISSCLVRNFHCVGTPEQLKIFCENYSDVEPQRFCFDLDSTLVSHPTVPGDYTTCQPLENNIKFLQMLKNRGHYIIIHTARRMKTHKGNLGAVVQDIGELTLQQLKQYNIVYDEIYFGKPWADYYIDDKAINCHQNLEKQLGFYDTTVASRDFNTLQIEHNTVTKRGKISGERYYYNQILEYPELVKYFARVIESSVEHLVLQKIPGLNFSYLYANNCLTLSQFELMLNALYKLHTTRIDYEPDKIITGVKNKIAERFRSYDYSKFGDSNNLYNQIMDFLTKFYNKHQIKPGIIHGDPVFSNVLIDSQNHITFIDMRGTIGADLTIAGDPVYDLAKVYQSLSGYDFILNGRGGQPDPELMNFFQDWIKEKYNLDSDDIRKYSASMYFSLIPLHDNNKCQKYFKLAEDLIH